MNPRDSATPAAQSGISGWAKAALLCGALSGLSIVGAMVINDFFISAWFLLAAIPLFIAGLVVAIIGSLKKGRRSLVVLLGFGVVIAAGSALYLTNLVREKQRVAECQARVEELLLRSPDHAIAARWGRFLRMEGSGHSGPPFMSPGGDYFIALRTAHFERGSVRVRIYVPGLSIPRPFGGPGLQIENAGPEIIVGFN